jgi:hypothetical protein
MMEMGQDILKSLGTSTPDFPPELSRFIRESEKLDSVLQVWQHSDSFSLALEHAEKGTKLMQLLNCSVNTRETPFFGFCCCQIVY